MQRAFSSIVTRTAVCAYAMRMPRTAMTAAFTTYSGGQPSEGQGGFYGAIKTRSERPVFQRGSRAEEADLEALTALMKQWEASEASADNKEQAWTAFVAKNPAGKELLKRLVVKGAPVWGLSLEQRQFVSRFQSQK
ncbi:TPA: hypothetical protein N0F65_002021 [Lagenidium giganteum]|uniref:Uncharacterized protein n=1 Tax=Lagenidium giganteum TaxID=4803 RepID=A0AAV2Z3R9_9STRA|nr:TPA: hypothetical protein N0F65_002021 [Lagenidium giganteum]